jgi:alanine dehydrogenase
VFGRRPERASEIAALGAAVEYRTSTPDAIAAELPDTDLLVGAVLIEGARAPHVVSEAMVRSMPEGSVIVDVSIDQGGCVATSRPTTHAEPVFVVDGVTHYCVTNMPGAYPRTSTLALTAATLPYVIRLADAGLAAAMADPPFAKGINTLNGQLTCRAVAEALGLTDRYTPLAEIERQ